MERVLGLYAPPASSDLYRQRTVLATLLRQVIMNLYYWWTMPDIWAPISGYHYRWCWHCLIVTLYHVAMEQSYLYTRIYIRICHVVVIILHPVEDVPHEWVLVGYGNYFCR